MRTQATLTERDITAPGGFDLPAEQATGAEQGNLERIGKNAPDLDRTAQLGKPGEARGTSLLQPVDNLVKVVNWQRCQLATTQRKRYF